MFSFPGIPTFILSFDEETGPKTHGLPSEYVLEEPHNIPRLLILPSI